MKTTYFPKKNEIKPKTYLIDAKGKILGRLAVKVANMLRGKDKPTFTPHVDTGDTVIVINAKEVKVTGKKLQQKMYQRYSGYPGGLKEKPLSVMLEKQPTEVIRRAIKKMLPGTPMGRKMFKKLRVYAGSEHKHAAQKPETVEMK